MMKKQSLSASEAKRPAVSLSLLRFLGLPLFTLATWYQRIKKWLNMWVTHSKTLIDEAILLRFLENNR